MESLMPNRQITALLQTDKSFADKIERIAKQIRPVLERNGVLAASLFGSIVRKQDTAQSDVDILVQYKDGTTLLDAAGIQIELEKTLGCKVDIVSEKYLHRRIRDQVNKERIRIL